MIESLKNSIKLADAVRYIDDIAKEGGFHVSKDNESLQRFFLNECLPIDQTTTPHLSKLLEKTCANLEFPSEAVHGFVYSNPVVQAECISAGNNECFVRISSQLVDILNPMELQFVLGHEIGHFLFGHSHQQMENQNLQSFSTKRAAEISADRMGLVASRSIKASISAILKTLSGLDDKHLNLDVSGYLDHIRKLKDIPADLSYAYLTHPPLPLRARAILWFSMSNEYQGLISNSKSGGLSKNSVDKKVATDLKNFVEKEVHKKQDQLFSDLRMWLFCAAAVQDGVLKKKEQSILVEEIGENDFRKLVALFQDKTAVEAKEFVFQKLNEVHATLRANALSNPNHETEKILKEVEKCFPGLDFRNYLKDHFHRMS